MLTELLESFTFAAMKKPAPKPKMHVLGVRVDPELKAAIDRAAAREDRSVSQWLALAAKAALKRAPVKDRANA